MDANKSKEFYQELLNTLPIVYYYGVKHIPTPKVVNNMPTSFNPLDKQIVLNYKQLDKVYAQDGYLSGHGLTDKQLDEKDKNIRAFFYHELSHAILTPKTLYQSLWTGIDKSVLTKNHINQDMYSAIVNIIEDERIETFFHKYYLRTDFEKNKRKFCFGDDYLDKDKYYEQSIANPVNFFLRTIRMRKDKGDYSNENFMIKMFGKNYYNYQSKIEEYIKSINTFFTKTINGVRMYSQGIVATANFRKFIKTKVGQVDENDSVDTTEDVSIKFGSPNSQVESKQLADALFNSKYDEITNFANDFVSLIYQGSELYNEFYSLNKDLVNQIQKKNQKPKVKVILKDKPKGDVIIDKGGEPPEVKDGDTIESYDDDEKTNDDDLPEPNFDVDEVIDERTKKDEKEEEPEEDMESSGGSSNEEENEDEKENEGEGSAQNGNDGDEQEQEDEKSSNGQGEGDEKDNEEPSNQGKSDEELDEQDKAISDKYDDNEKEGLEKQSENTVANENPNDNKSKNKDFNREKQTLANDLTKAGLFATKDFNKLFFENPYKNLLDIFVPADVHGTKISHNNRGRGRVDVSRYNPATNPQMVIFKKQDEIGATDGIGGSKHINIIIDGSGSYDHNVEETSKVIHQIEEAFRNRKDVLTYDFYSIGSAGGMYHYKNADDYGHYDHSKTFVRNDFTCNGGSGIYQNDLPLINKLITQGKKENVFNVVLCDGTFGDCEQKPNCSVPNLMRLLENSYGIIDKQVGYQLPKDFLTHNKKHIAIIKDSNIYPQALKKCVYDIVRDVVEKENSYAKHLKKHKDYEIILD